MKLTHPANCTSSIQIRQATWGTQEEEEIVHSFACDKEHSWQESDSSSVPVSLGLHEIIPGFLRSTRLKIDLRNLVTIGYKLSEIWKLETGKIYQEMYERGQP